MKVRLDRTTAGFHVEVGEIPTTGEWILQGTSSTYRARVPILPEQRLQAYLHPCTFLPYSDRFFRDLKEGEAADESSLPRMEGGGTATLTAPQDAADPQDYCHACTRSLLAHEAGPYCSDCGDD